MGNIKYNLIIDQNSILILGVQGSWDIQDL